MTSNSKKTGQASLEALFAFLILLALLTLLSIPLSQHLIQSQRGFESTAQTEQLARQSLNTNIRVINGNSIQFPNPTNQNGASPNVPI